MQTFVLFVLSSVAQRVREANLAVSPPVQRALALNRLIVVANLRHNCAICATGNAVVGTCVWVADRGVVRRACPTLRVVLARACCRVLLSELRSLRQTNLH